MDPIRIFVGTDRWQQKAGAELVLEHSIRQRTQRPVEITWMRSGDPGWEVSTDGRDGTWRVGAAVNAGWVKVPGRNWGTPFSGFRFAVPEVCGFEGRAIYLDSDMLVLADIGELWDMAPEPGYAMRSISWNRTDVAVIDCSWFKDRAWWPDIAEMKPSGSRVFEYIQLLQAYRAVDPTLPKVWNDCDGQIYNVAPQAVKLIHYTNVEIGQPYKPYDNVTYPPQWPHCLTSPSAGKLWWQTYDEARAAHAAD